MKTTLILSDDVVQRLKNRGVQEGRSMSSLVEEALVRFLDDAGPASTPEPADLPSFHAGVPHVDIADREALAAVMDHP